MKYDPQAKILSALPDPPDVVRLWLNDPWLMGSTTDHPYMVATDGFVLARIPVADTTRVRDGGVPAAAIRHAVRGRIGLTDDDADGEEIEQHPRPPAGVRYPPIKELLPDPWPTRPPDLLLDAKFLYRLARSLGAMGDGTDRRRPVRIWIDKRRGRLYVKPGASDTTDLIDPDNPACGVLMLIKP